jgi:hypothetical protein
MSMARLESLREYLIKLHREMVDLVSVKGLNGEVDLEKALKEYCNTARALEGIKQRGFF